MRAFFFPKTRHNFFLSAYLVLLATVNLVTGIYFLVAFQTVRTIFPILPPVAIILYGILCLANVVFAITIWRWKKWGVYGYAASVTGAYIANVIMTGSFTSLTGFLGLVILIFMIWPEWKKMM